VLLVAVARSSSDGVAIRYVLPVLRMTSCFYTVGPVAGRTASTVLCSELAPVDVAVAADEAPAAAAHWLGGQACWGASASSELRTGAK